MQPSTPEPEQKPKSIHDFLSLAGTIIPIIIGSSFLLSICYDYFFLATLNLKFSEIPSQISDHVRSAILWLPTIAGLISFCIHVFVGALLGGKKDGLHYSSTNERVQRIENTLWKIAPIILLFFITIFLPTDIQRTATIPIIILISFLYSNKDQPYYAIAEKYAKYLALISFIIMMISFSAHRDAREMLSAGNHSLLITAKINDTVSEIKANGIRRFSEFSIIVDETRKVIILPKDAILSTKNAKPIVIEESLACDYLKVMCADKVSAPAKAASSP